MRTQTAGLNCLLPRWLSPALACALATCACLSSSLAQAQQDSSCQQVNQPANAGFDFTESLSRWGAKEAYDMDKAPHTVDRILINRLPIFDENNPKENRLLYRWANALHILTRPRVLSDLLLFEETDTVDSQQLAESERLLRKQKYIGDAKIRVLQDCANKVDLEVVTREVWSLTPEINFKSTGGHSSTGIGIRDSNFLGTGQYLAFHYKTDQERNSAGLTFKNPNIGGSRHTFASEFQSNSDGHHYLMEGGLPFYALDSRQSWHVQAESVSEILNQYTYSQRVSRLQHDSEIAEISYGRSRGLIDDSSQRYSFGLHTEKHTLAGIPGTLPEPLNYRPDLDLNYAFVQYEFIEDQYTQGFNISQIYRTEDLHVGRQFRSRLGYAPDRDGSVIASTQYSDTLIYQPKFLLQVHADFDGRWDRQSGNWQDSLFSANLDLHRGQTANRSLYLGLQYNKALHLQNGRQLELGGNNGLRGFDTHFLQGDSSIAFTAEQRLFTNYHLLQLMRVGFAAYVDVGKVFGNPLTGGDSLYKNIGIGLRLAPSRSESGQVVHIDLAYPLNSEVPGGRDLQLIAQVKKSF